MHTLAYICVYHLGGSAELLSSSFAERSAAARAMVVVVIDLVPILEAAEKFVVPRFDSTDADEGWTADVPVAPPSQQAALHLVRVGSEVPAAGAAGEQEPADWRTRLLLTPQQAGEFLTSPHLMVSGRPRHFLEDFGVLRWRLPCARQTADWEKRGS